MLCQIQQIVIVAFSLALVIAGYIVVQDQLNPCLFKVGSVAFLNVFSAASFGFHPIVLTKLLTLLLYCSAAFHGVVAWYAMLQNNIAECPCCKLSLRLLSA